MKKITSLIDILSARAEKSPERVIYRFWNLFQFAGKQNIRYCSTDADFQI